MRGTFPLVKTNRTVRLKEDLTWKQLSKESFDAIDSITKRNIYVDALDWASHQVFDEPSMKHY
jgi:diketogulonate reductase-like aldo/keto reductase